jgi:hypothetical protein
MTKMVPGAKDIANPSEPEPDQVATQLLYNQKVIQLAFLVACLYTVRVFEGRSVIAGVLTRAACPPRTHAACPVERRPLHPRRRSRAP